MQAQEADWARGPSWSAEGDRLSSIVSIRSKPSTIGPSRSLVSIWLLLLFLFGLTGPALVRAQSFLPMSIKDYALLLYVGTGTGSGFLVDGDSCSFLVTARHVLFSSPRGDSLRSPDVTVSGFTGGQTQQFRFRLRLQKSQDDGRLLADTSTDVAVVLLKFGQSGITGRKLLDARYATMESPLPSIPVTCTYKGSLRRYDQVMVGNDIFVFGYPRSIGLARGIPQLDYERPLIHKGVVAGTNPARKTIILDSPVYWGNSGGPVVEIEETSKMTKFVPVGVVTQYIPLEESWANLTQSYTYSTRTVSSYSVAASLDTVLGFIKHWEK